MKMQNTVRTIPLGRKRKEKKRKGTAQMQETNAPKRSNEEKKNALAMQKTLYSYSPQI
jgi:hypothetical protein